MNVLFGSHNKLPPTAAPEGVGMSFGNRRETAAALLGGVDWRTDALGVCRCPGEHLHTTNTAAGSCQVMVDRVPTIHCLHRSCAGVVETVNRELRRAIWSREQGGDGRIKPWRPSSEDIERQAKKLTAERLKVRAESSLDQILRMWPWHPIDAFHESPITPGDVEDDWKLHLSMFRPDDVVWIGHDVRESGRPQHRRNFRPAHEWLRSSRCPGTFVCPTSFAPEACSRTQANALAARFLVVESDTLRKEQICCVFRWLRQTLRLRAIVDTGGKSLHGWFDYPTTEQLAELRVILPALECDPALFRPAQPVRLPGAKRGDNWQCIVWFQKNT